MRILHFFKTYYPDAYGGIQQAIYQLAEGAYQNGAEVEVLSLSNRKSPKQTIIGNHRVHTSSQDFYVASTGFSFSAFSDFRRLSDQVDVIHYHFPWPFMDIIHEIIRPNKPSILTYHSDIVKQKYLFHFYRPLMNHFLSSVDAVVATSPNYLQTSPVLSTLKVQPEVIPLGIDPHLYPKTDEKTKAKWQARVPKRFFLFVGFLRYYKGITFLLDALSRDDYPLVVIGEGPCEQELKEKVIRLGLQNVFFVGPLSDCDKNALLESCFCVVFPSHLRSEAYGITLLEASMYGKPMISCEIGTGTTYINIDGETGVTVPPANPIALREALNKLWFNQDIAQEMGMRARKRFLSNFTSEQMINSYMKLYKKVISHH